jgi:hypothetical protein
MADSELITGEPNPWLVLGHRLEMEIRRRIRELEARHPSALTSFDKRELSRLRELLRMGGRS